MEQHRFSNWKAKLWIPIGIGFFVAAFGLGLFAGTVLDIRSEIVDEAGEVEIEKVIDLYSKTRAPEVSFEQFWTVWDKIKERYVDQPIKDTDLFYGALQGLVAGLDDPHSVYLPPTDAEEFAKDLAGEFEGIGAEIGIRDNQLQIIAPLPSSPAEKAGLQAGDKIFAIDGVDTAGITIEKAVTNIRGKGGTTVVLTVSSNGFDTVRDVSIVRDTINIPTVDWRMLEEADDLAYLRISYFNQDTWKSFDKAVREILQQSPKGIVLDLRRNPGGFLQTSIDVASEWVEQGVIVRERMTGDQVKDHKSRGAHRLKDIPTVVLVDEGTASGSEIVAGALQDYNLATLVGVTTFGKGSVQDFEVLPDGSALKLTIAKWFTPNDRVIDGEGIAPDIIIEDMFVRADTGEAPTSSEHSAEVIDKGIEKAIELLK